MKTLREKLHSQSGASILLALLFLLVCMMAAASVLTAAVSNAGKIRSNYEEQQRYLALSSALRLVAGELEQAEYRGRYTVTQWTEILTETETDPEGRPVTVTTEYHYYSVQQEPGRFTCGRLAALKADGTSDGGALLPFYKELDGVFAKEFTGTGYHPLEGDEIAPLPTNPSSGTPRTRVLTVTAEGDLEKQFPPVAVEIDMSQSRRVHLTAKLEAGTTADGSPNFYILEAELSALLAEREADGTLRPMGGGMPVIGYSPEGRMPKDQMPEGPVVTETGVITTDFDSKSTVTEETGSLLTWRLDWITREQKEAE